MDHQKLLPLPQSFYNRNPIAVAQDLLGTYLIRKLNGEVLVGRVVETEAYLPFQDPAAHNFKGKTKRNASLYGEAGHLYVHSIRQYFCMDVVTEGMDIPGSVLLRAVEPINGIEVMQELRKRDDIYQLCSGPSKLCVAFGITLRDNGLPVTDTTADLFIARDTQMRVVQIVSNKRVGISKNAEPLLRFYIKDNKFVSHL